MIPIQRALSKNLNESLSVQRSKLSDVLVTVFDKNKGIVLPLVVFGTICVFGGTSIYYFLPKGFLLMDYALLLNIFLLILCGLIMGLTLLVNNLQGIVESTLAYLLFFWESKTMCKLLRKNLATHKSRNKLTSAIYALTLSCIIFLLVAADL